MLLSGDKYSTLVIALMFLSAPLLAGPFDSPAPRGDIRSAMYSIEDICQRLTVKIVIEHAGAGLQPASEHFN